MAEFYKGDSDILYIQVGSVFYPIGCLTSNSFEESSDEIDTTTRDNGGFKTSRPTNQSYSIPFEGIETLEDSIANLVTYKDLQNLKFNRTLVNYRLGDSVGKRIEGSAYVIDLSKTSPAGDLVTFNGTLRGFGKYNELDPSENNVFDYQLDFYI